MLQLVVSGVALGSVYAAAALIYNLTYQSSRVLSMSTGHMFMVGAIVGALFVGELRVPVFAAAGATVLVGLAVGFVTEVVALRPVLARSSEHLWLLSTLAAAIIIQQLAGLSWGTEPRPFPRLVAQDFAAGAWDQRYWFPIGYVLLLTAFIYGVQRTMTGKVFLAMAEDAFAARARGAPVERLRSLAFAAAGGLSALGGFAAGQLTFAYFAIGTALTLNGFIAVAVGGLGSNLGAIVGGLLLGLFTVLVTSLIGSQYQNTITVGLLVLVLIMRPSGLFSAARRRVV